MTALRDKMTAELALSGLAESTQTAYLEAANRLAIYYNISPERLTDEQVRLYFVGLIKQRHISQGYFKVSRAGVAFLYNRVCNRVIAGMDSWKPPRRLTLPGVMSVEEVRRPLVVVEDPVAWACMVTMYACGLRASEAARLCVSDIDSQRMVIAIRAGKGGKDRLVPLPPALLDLLRHSWCGHRNRKHLFPHPADSDGPPVKTQRLHDIMKKAAAQVGLRKNVTLHTLRHSYATHLLEEGNDLRLIQHVLGHASPCTTAVYTHVSDQALAKPLATAQSLLVRVLGRPNA